MEALSSGELLTLIWAAIIAFGVMMYVLMDGFDLGIGILFPFAPSGRDRDTMMNSVAPIWDANETWLVLGGAGLFAAFPIAYATLLPAFYLPLILMLVALIFRGVAFEFRFKAERSRFLWDISFHGGSLLATFAQGMVLGAFVSGVPTAEGAFAGGSFVWLSFFSAMTGLALIAGYGLLGATWLVMKTEGELQLWARRTSRGLLLAVLLFMGIVSLWVPFFSEAIAARWFSWPNIAWLAPVPLAVLLAALWLWRSVSKEGEVVPFLLAMGLFLLGYLGLAISLWPYIVPRSITIWDAASPPETQLFTLIGTALLLPLILGYTAWTYYVFRGKTRSGEGYH